MFRKARKDQSVTTMETQTARMLAATNVKLTDAGYSWGPSVLTVRP